MCPGNSNSIIHEKVFLNSNGTVNKNAHIDDLCTEKHVKMTFNNDPGFFQVDNETATMMEDPPFDLGDK